MKPWMYTRSRRRRPAGLSRAALGARDCVDEERGSCDDRAVGGASGGGMLLCLGVAWWKCSACCGRGQTGLCLAGAVEERGSNGRGPGMVFSLRANPMLVSFLLPSRTLRVDRNAEESRILVSHSTL